MPRFAFGKNWQRYLKQIDRSRIAAAEEELTSKLGDLKGLRFCDVGSGSGLFSLAAVNLGAAVRSFDYDPDSVAATSSLKERFAPDADWTISRGDALDSGFLAGLGTYDVVYSWGVLHHTGNLTQALDNVTELVAPGGRLWVAIYNDEGGRSRRWITIKRLYNDHPTLRPVLLAGSVVRLWGVAFVRGAAKGHPLEPFANSRGMSVWVDLVDWVGGWPFEVMSASDLRSFYETRGFTVEADMPGGNNQLVLRRPVVAVDS